MRAEDMDVDPQGQIGGNTVYDQPVPGGALRLDLSELRPGPQIYQSFAALHSDVRPLSSSSPYNSDGSMGVVPWSQEQMMFVSQQSSDSQGHGHERMHLHQQMYSTQGAISPFSLDGFEESGYEYEDVSTLYSTSLDTLSSPASVPSGDVNVFDIMFGDSLAMSLSPDSPPVSPQSMADYSNLPMMASDGSLDASQMLGQQASAFGYFDMYRYPPVRKHLSQQQDGLQMPQPAHLHQSMPVSAQSAAAIAHAARLSSDSPSSSPSTQPLTDSKDRSVSGAGGGSQHRRRFPCLHPGCGRKFTSQYTLKVHTDAHRPKPRPSFPCSYGPLTPVCPSSLSPDSPLDSPSGSPCMIGIPGGTCLERFSRQHDRLRHEVAKHGRVCEHSCAECGRFFSSRKTLGNHKCPVLSARGGTRWVE